MPVPPIRPFPHQFQNYGQYQAALGQYQMAQMQYNQTVGAYMARAKSELPKIQRQQFTNLPKKRFSFDTHRLPTRF